MPTAISPQLSTIPGPRGPVAVARWGSGPPLLLLSGLGSGRKIWGELPSVLARRFTVITPDNRGIGGSREGEPFTLEGSARDAAIPGCRFRVVPGAAHSVLAEGGPVVIQEISDFLAGVPA